MSRVVGSEWVDIVVDEGAEVGEGPVWDDSAQELLWVDIPRHQVHRLHPDSGRRTTVDVGQPVGAVALRAAGGLVLALRDGFAVMDSTEAGVRMVCEVESDRADTRMNDGKCDSVGRFWAGTMAADMTPGAGTLYRLDPDLSVHTMLSGTTVSNGLAWSDDDRVMFFVDSGMGAVDAFDYDIGGGTLSGRRRTIDVAPQDGLPDGMAIDAEGYLWVAVWDGWSVRRYGPDGSVDTVIQLPTAQITSCTFGGHDLDQLYITSAASGLTVQQRRDQPHAGAIFVVRPGVSGMPTARFAG
ncbi:MAG: SMP-30/gluconolactonase/LRE family protein [Euzebya sp.]